MKSDNAIPENFELTENVVQRAYLFLKDYVYHENVNFFLKQKIAEFECGSFDGKIKDLSLLLKDENFTTNSVFTEWLESIDCHVLPKLVRRPEDEDDNDKENGLVISNVTSSSEYIVEKVNYFISASVELNIIEVLWCLVIGPILDENLSESCYGNRLHDQAKKFIHQKTAGNSRSLFKYYVRQYGSWRDQALSVATDIHKNNENVALLSLDLKSYFYNVKLDFSKIDDEIETDFEDKDRLRGIALKLNKSLKMIFSAYREKIAPYLEFSHPECNHVNLGLPIGFASSSVLGNWYLANFDKDILERARPDYYGRYVDDIIMVFRNPETDCGDNLTVKSIVSKFLSEHLIEVDETANDSCFYIEVDDVHRLPVQKDKLIFYRLEKEHSRAVLEVFREELQERSSAFRFLPGEEIDRELDRFAYDILYEGSGNKLRSIAGLRENATELASYLARHIILHRLCKMNRKDSVLPQLERFFKGKNVLRFSRLWEKVYQYAVVVRDYDFIRTFYGYLDSEIKKAGVYSEGNRNETLSRILLKDLRLYNKISLGLSVALLGADFFQLDGEISGRGKRSKRLLLTLVGDERIKHFATAFRDANLFRHSLVAWPLVNFTGFSGDLTDEREFRKNHMNLEGLDFNDEKIQRSPRFIHFDEWQLFYLQKSLAGEKQRSLLQWQEVFRKEHEKYFSGTPVERSGDGLTSGEMQVLKRLREAFVEEENLKDTSPKYSISVGKKLDSLPKKIRIALANVKISKSDIENAVRKDKKPNISFERQTRLYEIMNSAVRERADVLVMPELSTPVSWLPFMAAHCRKHQLAIIFGLEHWEVCGHVYNLLVELLPFKLSEKYNSCYMTARVKNHYAPAELKLIDNLRLKKPPSFDDREKYYNKISWRGINFASYNCFELSDIEHRARFKSEIDILFACVCNRDTNYYQSILESAVRDMHCYVVQSNASQYGGSCVLKPAKTEEKTMLCFKGGENPCVLVTEIDVAALRDFQYKPNSRGKAPFKSLPPGFDSEKVLER